MIVYALGYNWRSENSETLALSPLDSVASAGGIDVGIPNRVAMHQRLIRSLA
jgi:hypothetical protein